MKKILSLLVCMCMVIGMLPAFTVSAADAPTWVATIGTAATPGTLIADYNFADTEVPGQAIVNNFPKDASVASNEYAAEYTSEGFKFTKLQDGTTDNNGSTSYDGRINFVSVTDEASKSYETGFRGTYVVDLTVKANMAKPSENTAKNPPRLDFWMGYNEDITSYLNSNTSAGRWNGLRYTSANTLTLYDNKTSGSASYIDGGILGTTVPDTDTTHRFVFDTVNGQIAHYVLQDGVYAYVGSGAYYGNSVQGMSFNPRLGFAKDSYFIFKNVKIYEVTRAQEPLIKVVNITPDPDPEPGDGPIVADPENNIPDWTEVAGLSKTPGTVIADYGFANTEIPGQAIVNNFPTDATVASNKYAAEYTSEGFKFTRLEDGTTDNATTGSGLGGRINFVKITDEATKSYESGFRGTYVVEMTVKSNMSRPSGVTKNVRFDMSFGYNEDITSRTNANTTSWNNIRVMHDNSWRLYDNLSSNAVEYIEEGADRTLAKGEDETLKFVFDTVNSKIAYFRLVDDEYAYVGSGVFYGDSVQGLTFTPRLGFAKDSYFIFKNVKIYEVEKAAEPLIKVDNTTTTPDPDPDPTPDPDPEPDPEPGDGPIVADPTNNIPDWAEVIGLTKEPGTKVADYKITGSNIPGESIANTLNSSGDFKAEYTKDGFTWTKLTEPAQADRATQSGLGGVLQFVGNLGEDDANGTKTYQHGFVGTYVVDMYVNSNLTMNLTGSAARYDWSIGYQSDLSNGSKVDKTFNTVRVTSGDSGNLFTVYGSSGYDQGDRAMPRNEDTIVRMVIDTKAGEMAYFIYKNNEFVFAGNGAYSGDIIQSIYFTPRLGFAKGSTFTFKGVKIYEIEKYINPTLGVADRNQSVINAVADTSIMPVTLVANPGEVTENITMPAGDWSTTNDEVVTNVGVVKRGYDDEDVYLINKFKTPSTPSLSVYRYYNLTVPKRVDVVNEVIGEKELNLSADEEISFLVNRYIAEDANSATYVNNLAGVYDFEFEVTPTHTVAYEDGGKPSVVEIGYYDENSGEYKAYATAEIYSDVIRYFANLSGKTSVAVKNGEKNVIKFRIDTVNKKIWIYVNGVKSAVKVYTGNNFVNSFSVYMDENAPSGDSVVLNKYKLVSLFAFDNSDFADSKIVDCSEAVKNITIADVTANPADAYGALGNMPSTVGGYKVEWTADSEYVDVASKYAYRSAEDNNVVVTAKVYDSKNPDTYVSKDFYITIKGTTDSELLLEGSTSKLTAKYITNQPADALITDIVLPDNIAGNPVKWSVSPSSPSDVLSADGKINKNKDISEPTKVTLVATVTNGSATVYKNIDFVVAKRGGDVAFDSIVYPVTGVVTYAATVNGALTLKDTEGKKIIELNSNGNVKVVMDFNNSKVSVFENDILVHDYIDFAEDAVNFGGAEAENATNEKFILDEYALYYYNLEKFGYLDEIGKGVVTSDVDMSEDSFGGVKVKWSSENTSILTNEGTYNAPSSVTLFDVTLSLTLPGGTGAEYTEIINVVAIPENNIFESASVVNQGTSVPAGEYKSEAAFDGNYTDTMFRGSFANETKSIVIDLLNVQDINTMYIAHNGIKSFNVYVSDDKINWDMVAQPSFDGTIDNNIVNFNKKNTRYVKIDTITYDGSYVDIYEIAGFAVYDSSDKSYIDIIEINMPQDFVLNASSITLPTTGSMYGSKLVWASSHPGVISTDGTITTPKNNTEVLLTVTSTNGDATSTMTFRYYIKGTNGAQGGTSTGGSGGGGGGVYVGDSSASAFPEANTNVQTPVTSEVSNFNDVSKDAWFYGYVMDLRKAGIIDGDNKNNYNPDSLVTREEFIKMIVNVSKLELVESGTDFNDVKSTDWFAPYVYTAKANGIVNGVGEGKFGVGSAISRQDMAVIISNILDIDIDISTNKDLFNDNSSIASYAYNAVYSMKSLGILNGYDDGNYKPQGKLTRAEAAKVISMVMDIIK